METSDIFFTSPDSSGQASWGGAGRYVEVACLVISSMIWNCHSSIGMDLQALALGIWLILWPWGAKFGSLRGLPHAEMLGNGDTAERTAS